MHSAWKLVLLVIPLAVMACGQSESAESGAEAAPATALPLTVEVNERLQLTLDCELELNGDQLLLKQVSDYPLASEQLQLTQQQGDTLGAKMARVLELLELEERDVALHLRARHQQKDTYVDLFVSRAPQVELPTILSEMAERRGIQGSVLSTNEALAGALPGMFDVQLRADELGDCRHWGFLYYQGKGYSVRLVIRGELVDETSGPMLRMDVRESRESVSRLLTGIKRSLRIEEQRQ